MAVADSTESQLTWEARQRPRAAVAAILAALLTLGAVVWNTLIFKNAPPSGLLEALQKVTQPGAVGQAHSGRDAFFVLYHSRSGEIIAAAVVQSIGYLALGWTLSFVAAATRARRAEMPRLATYLPLVGAVLQAVATLLGTIVYAAGVSTYIGGPRTVDAAADVTSNSVLLASQLIGFVGGFAVAAAFVLVCLHAMRAGLLTRFMGVLGIIVGVLQIIPAVPVPVVQTFWLFAVAVLLFGAWPGAGVPPAWRTGRAEPWPGQAEAAQRRRAAAEARRGRGRGAVAAPAPAPEARPTGGPGDRTGAARRKRKRRR